MIIRQLAIKLHSLMLERRSAPRHRFCVPVTVTISAEENSSAKLLTQKTYSTSGFTRDLSDVGIAFCVGSIRLNEYYLVGEERPLTAKLELPDGSTITMQIVGVRYERENKNLIELKYLIGARIVRMDAADRKIYRQFLERNAGKQKETVQDFSADKPES